MYDSILSNLGVSRVDYERADNEYGTDPICICIKSGLLDVNFDFRAHPLYIAEKPVECSPGFVEYMKLVASTSEFPDLYAFLYVFD